MFSSVCLPWVLLSLIPLNWDPKCSTKVSFQIFSRQLDLSAQCRVTVASTWKFPSSNVKGKIIILILKINLPPVLIFRPILFRLHIVAQSIWDSSKFIQMWYPGQLQWSRIWDLQIDKWCIFQAHDCHTGWISPNKILSIWKKFHEFPLDPKYLDVITLI